MKKNYRPNIIELLTVIIILAILVGIGLIMHGSVNKRARDAVRLADLAKLYQAIIVTTYDSANLAQDLCFGIPLPCQGVSIAVNSQNTDGTGWIKMNFNAKQEINLSLLPLDPHNDATYNYTYYSDGSNWKIKAILESNQYKSKMQSDGGTDPDKYEIGSNLRLLP